MGGPTMTPTRAATRALGHGLAARGMRTGCRRSLPLGAPVPRFRSAWRRGEVREGVRRAGPALQRGRMLARVQLGPRPARRKGGGERPGVRCAVDPAMRRAHVGGVRGACWAARRRRTPGAPSASERTRRDAIGGVPQEIQRLKPEPEDRWRSCRRPRDPASDPGTSPPRARSPRIESRGAG
jgi:hypothetical protein